MKLTDIKQSWIMVGAAVVVVAGLLGAQFFIVKASQWYKDSRDHRITTASDSVTPNRLIARCGAALEDTTTDLYPVVRRTMRYKLSGQRTALFTFTRTADEPEGWVLLSMKDSVGDVSYETPEAMISAMSCLDSTK